jgi:hypothetical protein
VLLTTRHYLSYFLQSVVAVQCLYEALAHRCKLCALRCPSERVLAAHMDWHFKVRKR